MNRETQTAPQWLAGFTEEDFAFLRRFLLASGSLKAVAEEYDISYPTVRLRLDRLIEKVRLADDPRNESPFVLLVRSMVVDGKLAPDAARTLLRAHDAENKERKSP